MASLAAADVVGVSQILEALLLVVDHPVGAEVADVTGLVLTKMDGTAKGGVIVGLADEFAGAIKCGGAEAFAAFQAANGESD